MHPERRLAIILSTKSGTGKDLLFRKRLAKSGFTADRIAAATPNRVAEVRFNHSESHINASLKALQHGQCHHPSMLANLLHGNQAQAEAREETPIFVGNDVVLETEALRRREWKRHNKFLPEYSKHDIFHELNQIFNGPPGDFPNLRVRWLIGCAAYCLPDRTFVNLTATILKQARDRSESLTNTANAIQAAIPYRKMPTELGTIVADVVYSRIHRREAITVLAQSLASGVAGVITHEVYLTSITTAELYSYVYESGLTTEDLLATNAGIRIEMKPFIDHIYSVDGILRGNPLFNETFAELFEGVRGVPAGIEDIVGDAINLSDVTDVEFAGWPYKTRTITQDVQAAAIPFPEIGQNVGRWLAWSPEDHVASVPIYARE